MKKLLLFAGFVVFSTHAFAQVTVFTYQGRLQSGANFANGSFDLRFALYDAASSGGQQGNTLTNSATVVSNGLFTVTLDFGNQFPGADRWLEIGVRTNGSGAFTTLSPRQRITSAPYAIQSANATSASTVSGPVSAAQLTGTISSNNIGVGSITTVMLAAGAVGSNQLAVGAVTTTALADGAVTAAKVATVSNLFMLTIPDPTPAPVDFFGFSMAALGSDRVIIGAYRDDTGATDAGAAYLFNAYGALLTTFTNPTPETSDSFGFSVAALGGDRVLVGTLQDNTGASRAGAAYLFSTNGTLLTTFTNPFPAANDFFGNSVAGLGSDRVLIAANSDDAGTNNAGSVYLFSTNGTLLATFTNPVPKFDDQFGSTVVAVGNSYVAIGADNDDTAGFNAGAAYLFSTNGSLLTTFAKPAAVSFEGFGHSIAALGSDRVLIGTKGSGAYLFNVNGTLLTTFTDPNPAPGFFGWAVAAAGTDRVLISAYLDDTGADDAGAAYLLNTNGTLLITFTNPTPAASDFFGYSVAALGSDRWLIGANQDDTTAANSGSAYLFSFATYTPGLIADGARPGAIDASMLAENSVTAQKLANDAVTTSALADGAVGSSELAPGAVTTAALANSAVTAAKVAVVSNWFPLTIAKPTPVEDDQFGYSMAALGNDRMLIGTRFDDAGATNAGAVHLFSTNGSLLMTFTNPTPATFDYFGYSVAGFGTDRVLIGAPYDDAGGTDSGLAYLFSANGALLMTYTNAYGQAFDNFGISLAALGSGQVLIGAQGYDDGTATDAGKALIFSTNGTYLRSISNPNPAKGDHFGSSVAILGSDRVLIGAPQDGAGATGGGVAYLIATNNSYPPLATFTNPTPMADERFGFSVATLGNDRVLIGAHRDNMGGSASGSAYLFRTNGTLLTTFTNPFPANGDGFGYSVATLGSDRILIGALNDGGTVGAAYLFNTNGTLLWTFNNPSPAGNDYFGIAVTAVGSDQALIGAYQDDTSATNAGSAYLFTSETYTPNLIADAVNAGSITAASIADSAVTTAKLAPDIGVWTRAGNNVYRPSGNVGIGVTSPQAALHILGGDILAGATQEEWIFHTRSSFGGDFLQITDLANGTPQWQRGLTLHQNGNLGLGTTAPAQDIHVYGADSRLRLEATSSSSYAATEYLGNNRTWHTGIGGSATTAELAGNYYVYDATANAVRFVINTNGYAMFTGGLQVSGSYFDVYASTYFHASGSVTMNTDLYVYGGAYKTGGGSWGTLSDVRLKKNIQPLSGALDKLLALRGVTFEFIDPEKIHELSGERMGLIAQEVEKVIPDWVETGKDGYKRVTVRGLEALVVEALRELQQKEEGSATKLTEELKHRDEEIAELKQRLEKLERRFNGRSEGGR
jgi:hypothetical protein